MNKKKKLIIVGIQFAIGLAHIIGVGRHSGERLFMLSISYFSDFSLPFGFYFLLKLIEEKITILEKFWVKSCVVFLMATLSEIAQYFGVYVLGRTFDPIDIAVYAAGVLLAVFVDYIFSIIFKFWNTDSRKAL